MRGLIIRDPWIGHILSGRKTWEIRSKATGVRERIGLIRGGSGTIVGTANLVDSRGPFTLNQLVAHEDKPAVPEPVLAEFVAKYDGRAFAWMLADVKSLPRPGPYQHPMLPSALAASGRPVGSASADPLAAASTSSELFPMISDFTARTHLRGRTRNARTVRRVASRREVLHLERRPATPTEVKVREGV